MALFFFHLLFLISLLFSSGVAQGTFGFIALYDSTWLPLGSSSSHSGLPIAVSMPKEHLREVSSSVLRAETWVRGHLLAHYPASNITTVVVGHNVLCSSKEGHGESPTLVLQSLKNIHYVLTRWGLQREIKASASFSSSCLDTSGSSYRDDLGETQIRPILNFLRETNSAYLVNPPSSLPTFSDEAQSLVTPHSDSIRNLGISDLGKINVVVTGSKDPKTTSRKLSFIDSMLLDPFPERPTPLSPAHSPMAGSSDPAYAANSPLPPLVGKVSPPPISSPELPPLVGRPDFPPYGPHLPPCDPSVSTPVAAPPVPRKKNGLWCVAKPSVPPEALQEALDYACGEGGADCDEIRPHGSCYIPETTVAHASYAFNDYWQKNKNKGGSCGFGGTAMLINSDPSYQHCRFILA